jgi:AcrR family transcriptional regulator
LIAILFNIINSNIKTQSVRKYKSPLRKSQTQDTRERILEALSRLLATSDGDEFSFDALAAEAEVERRTLFRHFSNKETLFDAFWEWINARIARATVPTSPEGFSKVIPDVFDGFDQHDGIIRASIHMPSGRSMRLRTVEKRRTTFSDALRDATKRMNPGDARRFVALVHLHYSAQAWETLKDYAGLSGREAGETASWAMETLMAALARDR